MTWLPALVAAFLLVAAIGVRAAAPAGDESIARAAALTFDEHAAVASALLQPDLPQLTDTPHADALEDWLRTHTNQES